MRRSPCTTRATSRSASPSCSTASTPRWPISSSPWPTSTARGGGSSWATRASSISCTESWDSPRAPPFTGRPPPNSSSATRRSSSHYARASSASRAWWSREGHHPREPGRGGRPLLPRLEEGGQGGRGGAATVRGGPHREVVTVTRPVAPRRMSIAADSPSARRNRVHPDEPRGDAPSPPASLLRPAAPVRQPDEAEPLTAELRRYHITVSKRFLAKLSAARDALSHTHPGADTETVLEAALDLLLAKHDRKKGLVKKPRRRCHAVRAGHGTSRRR